MALDTRFNLDPAKLQPNSDYARLLYEGTAGIGDTIQKNRATRAKLNLEREAERNRVALAGQESEWRRLEAEREQRNWDATMALNTRKENFDEAHPPHTSPDFWQPDPNKPGALMPTVGGPYDKDRIAEIAKARYRTPGTKLLPKPLQDDLTVDGQDLGNMGRITTTWKPDYGGHTATGELTNDLGRMGFGASNKDQANWWADYRANIASIKRNRLYGASLTDNERADFDRNDINPGMDAGLIQKNLTRQRDILRIAATRKAGGLIAQQADPTAVEQYLGIHLEDLGFKIKRGNDNRISEITEFPVIEGMDFGSGGYSTAGSDPNSLGTIQPSE